MDDLSTQHIRGPRGAWRTWCAQEAPVEGDARSQRHLPSAPAPQPRLIPLTFASNPHHAICGRPRASGEPVGEPGGRDSVPQLVSMAGAGGGDGLAACYVLTAVVLVGFGALAVFLTSRHKAATADTAVSCWKLSAHSATIHTVQTASNPQSLSPNAPHRPSSQLDAHSPRDGLRGASTRRQSGRGKPSTCHSVALGQNHAPTRCNSSPVC
jgi:hypothetical protein